jgi:NADPH:quinone reductase-like Zn-dependent oxidoreductase
MLAIEISTPGEPDVLVPAERPMPVAGANELLIHVAAAGVNRPDVMQRRGKYPPPPGASDIPGLEVAGTVAALGDGVRDFRVGDTVCALVSGGGYAEYCVAPAPQCLPVPAGLDVVAAAAIPETFFTVWTNVFERGRLNSGESILIHGGSSGIGTTAIQLAHAWGARVFATAGSPEKCRACETLGAERGINYRDGISCAYETPPAVAASMSCSGGWREYFPRNSRRWLRPICRDCDAGGKVELNLQTAARRLTITGSTPSAVDRRKRSSGRRCARTCLPLTVSGTGTDIFKTFPCARPARRID